VTNEYTATDSMFWADVECDDVAQQLSHYGVSASAPLASRCIDVQPK